MSETIKFIAAVARMAGPEMTETDREVLVDLGQAAKREHDKLTQELRAAQERIAALESPMSYLPPGEERLRALLAIAKTDLEQERALRDEAKDLLRACLKVTCVVMGCTNMYDLRVRIQRYLGELHFNGGTG